MEDGWRMDGGWMDKYSRSVVEMSQRAWPPLRESKIRMTGLSW